MPSNRITFGGLVLVALIARASDLHAQDHCWIKYTYDAAGNRVERSWWCGTPGPEEYDSPKSLKAEEGYGLVAGPNPANSEFTLRSETDLAGAECRILDAQGRTVLTQRGEGTTAIFNVAGLSVGAYTLHVRLATDEYQTRLIIAR